jgi:hypothetical protein
MASSGMLLRVALVRTDVSEERFISIIIVTRIGELGTTLILSSKRRAPNKLLCLNSHILSSPILVTLMMRATHSAKTSVLTGVTLRQLPEDGILVEETRS